MKKIVLAILCSLVFVGSANAQKPEVAIYVSCKEGVSENDLPRVHDLMESIGGEYFSGDYKFLPRAPEVFEAIKKEWGFMRSGLVPKEEMAKIGAAYGADNVLNIHIGKSGGLYEFTARIIDVEKIAFVEGTKTMYYCNGEDDCPVKTLIDSPELRICLKSLWTGLHNIKDRKTYFTDKENNCIKNNKRPGYYKAFIPGMAQISEGKNVRGGCMIAVTALGAAGVIVSDFYVRKNLNAADNSINHPESYRYYKDKANTMKLSLAVSGTILAGIYVWNLIDGMLLIKNSNKNYAISPTFYRDGGMGVAITYKF